MICSLLRSLITYIHGTVFLTFLITKTSSDQFDVYPLAKIFLYFEILTWLPTLNLGSLSLPSFLKSIYVLSLTQQVSSQLFYGIYYYIHLLYHLIYQYTHSLILMSCICKFSLINLSNKSFSNNRFSFIIYWIHINIIIF